jgi:sugar lactone lactonase YvrE
VRTIAAELALDAHAHHGEGPVWLPDEQRLAWVDLVDGHLHRFHPATGSDSHIAVGESLGAAAARARGGFVLAVRSGFALLEPGSETAAPLVRIDNDGGRLRMNDGACDPQGRFWAGTMTDDLAANAGSLYRLDPDGTVHRMLTDVTVSNGIDWSPDLTAMYYIDSLAGVDVFDFDADSGTIGNRRRIIDPPSTAPPLMVPDGMTLDAEGHLWIAVYGAGEVRRYAPDGAHELTVTVPVPGTTSCAFGGSDLGDLFITTMHIDGSDAPHAGALFACRPGVVGRPANLFAA